MLESLKPEFNKDFVGPIISSAHQIEKATFAYANADGQINRIQDIAFVPWSDTVAYSVGDVVKYSGSFYIAINDNIGHAPTNFREVPLVPGVAAGRIFYDHNWSTLVLVGGEKYVYTLVLQVPVPFLTLDIRNLIGNFVLPVLSVLGIPQAMSWLVDHAQDLVNNIMDDVMTLIRAIPEASVLIVIRVGEITVINLQLVAEKVPVTIPVPTFVLNLPNLAVNLNLAIPFPVPPPIVRYVPIPVPIVPLPKLPVITGGQVSATVGASLKPFPVENPVSMPTI